jgi:hypothetical protein
VKARRSIAMPNGQPTVVEQESPLKYHRVIKQIFMVKDEPHRLEDVAQPVVEHFPGAVV